MAPLCELQAKHGVELETGYKNNQAYVMFIEYIANEQRILLNDKLKNAKYFSIQADRSTDCANKGLFLALFLTHTQMKVKCTSTASFCCLSANQWYGSRLI